MAGSGPETIYIFLSCLHLILFKALPRRAGSNGRSYAASNAPCRTMKQGMQFSRWPHIHKPPESGEENRRTITFQVTELTLKLASSVKKVRKVCEYWENANMAACRMIRLQPSARDSDMGSDSGLRKRRMWSSLAFCWFRSHAKPAGPVCLR